MIHRQFFVAVGLVGATVWALAAGPDHRADAQSAADAYTVESQAAIALAGKYGPLPRDRAERLAARGRERLAAGAFAEALALFREARWSLPYDPPGQPTEVTAVFGAGRIKHAGQVRAVAVSPDGKYILTGCDDGTAVVWDANTGRRVQECRQAGSVRAVAWRPDGAEVASGCGGDGGGAGSVALWNPETGEARLTLKGHTGYITTLAYRPDGKQIATGADDKAVRLWEADSGKPLQTVTTRANQVTGVSFAPNGQLLAVADGGGRLAVFGSGATPQRATPLMDLDAHPGGGAYCVAFTPDGSQIAVGGPDAIKLYGSPRADGTVADKAGALVRTFLLPSGAAADRATALAFAPDGRTLASAGNSGVVRLWDRDPAVQGSGLSRTLAGHTDAVYALAFSPDGNLLYSGGLDGQLRPWDLAPTAARTVLNGSTGHIWGSAVSPDGRYVATGGADRRVRLWNLVSGQAEAVLTGHDAPVTAVAYLPGGRQLVSAAGDKSLKLWDVGGGNAQRSYPGHTGAVLAVASHPTDAAFVSGGWDRAVKLWDVAGDQARLSLAGHGGAVTAVAFAPDGKRFASADTAGMVKLWAWPTGEPGPTFRAHDTGGVAALAFSSDGKALATCGADGQAKVWRSDGTLKEPLAILAGHTGPLSAVAYAPAGGLATAGADGVVKLWDVATRTELQSFRGHTDWIGTLAFAPDGQSLVSAGVDRTGRVWRTATDGSTAEPRGHAGKLLSLAVSPDGTRLASTGADRATLTWDVPRRAVIARHIGSGQSYSPNCVAFSLDGTSLVVCGEDPRVRIIDAATGAELRSAELGGRANIVAWGKERALAWVLSPAGDESKVVGIDPATGKSEELVNDKGRGVSCIALPLDGSLAAMSGPDRTIKVWDLATKVEVSSLAEALPKTMRDLVFTPDASLLIAINEEGDARVMTGRTLEPKHQFKTGVPNSLSLAASADNRLFAALGAGGRLQVFAIADGKLLNEWSLPVAATMIQISPDSKTVYCSNVDGTLTGLAVP